METVEDFDKWLAEYKPAPVKYVAVYDQLTGAVISVGPDYAFPNEACVVEIDSETALSIITAEIQIHHCQIDIHSGELEIAETRTLNKLDDVLHRIPLIQYADIAKPDIYLTHTEKSQTLKIQLSTEFGGNKKYKEANKQRKFVWDGSTEMDFLITEYNDPNLIYKMFSVKINDLVGKTVTVKNVYYDNFSVYTRRLFKNYVIELK
jgi:hypothetical protein